MGMIQTAGKAMQREGQKTWGQHKIQRLWLLITVGPVQLWCKEAWLPDSSHTAYTHAPRCLSLLTRHVWRPVKVPCRTAIHRPIHEVRRLIHVL